MFCNILGCLLVAWLLNLFGFYGGVFYPFVQSLAPFEVTIGFYYGTFCAIGLIWWIFSSFNYYKSK